MGPRPASPHRRRPARRHSRPALPLASGPARWRRPRQPGGAEEQAAAAADPMRREVPHRRHRDVRVLPPTVPCSGETGAAVATVSADEVLLLRRARQIGRARGGLQYRCRRRPAPAMSVERRYAEATGRMRSACERPRKLRGGSVADAEKRKRDRSERALATHHVLALPDEAAGRASGQRREI